MNDLFGGGELIDMLSSMSFQSRKADGMVAAAVLDDTDSTLVKIGNAISLPGGGYSIDNSPVKLEPDSKDADGLYRVSGATYAVISTREFERRQAKKCGPAGAEPCITNKGLPTSPPSLLDDPLPPLPQTSLLDDSPPAACSAACNQPIATPLPSTPPSVGATASASVESRVTRFDADCHMIAVVAACDATRLDFAIKEAEVSAASEKKGSATFVVLGGSPPSLTHGDGAMERAVTLANNSTALRRVELLATASDFPWLLLVDSRPLSRVLCNSADPQAAEVLSRPLYFASQRKQAATVATLHAFRQRETEPELAVCMLLKLQQVEKSFKLPLIYIFLNRLLSSRCDHDVVSLNSLINFVNGSDGSLSSGCGRLLQASGLTPEGITVAPAARMVVGAVLSYARGTMFEFLCRAHTALEVQEGRIKGTVVRDEALQRAALGSDCSSTEESALFRKLVANLKRGEDCGSRLLDECLACCAKRRAARSSVVVSVKHVPKLNASLQRASIVNDTQLATLQRSAVAYTEDRRSAIPLCSHVCMAVPDIRSGFQTCVVSCKEQRFVSKLSLKSDASELLEDTSFVIATVLSFKVNDTLMVKDFGIDNVVGLVGAIVVGTPYRVVYFSSEQCGCSFAALISDKLLLFALGAVNLQAYRLRGTRPALSATQQLEMPHASLVQLDFPSMTRSELEFINAKLGPRVWQLGTKHVCVENGMKLTLEQSSDDGLVGMGVKLVHVDGYQSRMTVSPT